MKIQSTTSHNKIILLLVFLCASIVTLLFVFHLRNEEKPIELSGGSGIFFPVGREIQPFELTALPGGTFTQQNFRHHWTLLFFGFTHCSAICPTTLQMLSHAYIKLKPHYANLSVVFVSLDPKRDSLQAVQTYTQTFNPAFIGVRGKVEEIRKLQSQFGIYAEQDSGSSTNYQLNHTASILLINPEGKYIGYFNAGMSPTQFIQAFNEAMKYFS